MSQTLSKAPLDGGFVSAVIRQVGELASAQGWSTTRLQPLAEAWCMSLDQPAGAEGLRARARALADYMVAVAAQAGGLTAVWRLARALGVAQWGMLGYGLLTAPTALAALEFDERLQPLSPTGLHFRHTLEGGRRQCAAHAPVHPHAPAFWVFVLGCRLGLLESAGGSAAGMARVCLPCEPAQGAQRLFFEQGLRVSFGTAHYEEWHVGASLLRLNPNASPEVHRLLATAVSSAQPVVGQGAAEPSLGEVVREAVRQAIRADLDRGVSPTWQTVAPRLHRVWGTGELGLRQLQRRLAASQLGFRDLVADVRRERALEHLRQGTRPLADIAAEAGYAELSSFHRAVRRWTGSTPMAYRDEAAGNRPGEQSVPA